MTLCIWLLIIANKEKARTLKRYQTLHQECIRRGFEGIKDKSGRWDTWNPKEDIDYVPTGRDILIIKERIITRITNSTGQFHYCRKRIEKGDLIDLL